MEPEPGRGITLSGCWPTTIRRWSVRRHDRSRREHGGGSRWGPLAYSATVHFFDVRRSALHRLRQGGSDSVRVPQWRRPVNRSRLRPRGSTCRGTQGILRIDRLLHRITDAGLVCSRMPTFIRHTGLPWAYFMTGQRPADHSGAVGGYFVYGNLKRRSRKFMDEGTVRSAQIATAKRAGCDPRDGVQIQHSRRRGDAGPADGPPCFFGSTGDQRASLISANGDEQLALSRFGLDPAEGGRNWSRDPRFLAARRFEPCRRSLFPQVTEPYVSIAAAGDPRGTVLEAEVDSAHLGCGIASAVGTAEPPTLSTQRTPDLASGHRIGPPQDRPVGAAACAPGAPPTERRRRRHGRHEHREPARGVDGADCRSRLDGVRGTAARRGVRPVYVHRKVGGSRVARHRRRSGWEPVACAANGATHSRNRNTGARAG